MAHDYEHLQCGGMCVNKEQSDWFARLVGLRQGCVLSPILFAIFIDSMARTIQARSLGVEVMNERIGALLIADDLALHLVRISYKKCLMWSANAAES